MLFYLEHGHEPKSEVHYWAALSLSFRLISIQANLYHMFINIIAWGPQVRSPSTCKRDALTIMGTE